MIAIVGRIREVMGEATFDWEMMEWLAKDAPKDMYSRVWLDVIHTHNAAKRKKEGHNLPEVIFAASEPLSWDQVQVRRTIIIKPSRLATVDELFALRESGFELKPDWYWVDDKEQETSTHAATFLPCRGVMNIGRKDVGSLYCLVVSDETVSSHLYRHDRVHEKH